MISGWKLLKSRKNKKRSQFNSEKQHYICTSKDCLKLLRTKVAFEHHIKICQKIIQTKSENNSKQIYSCKLCNYTTDISGNLFVHHRKHTKIRPYYCKLCTQTYGHRSNLRNHIISTHWKFKQFQCPICNQSFTLKPYLKQHLLKHKESKQYRCIHCDKAYKFEGTLYKHLKCHDAAKAYCCQFCSKTIQTKFEYRKHLRTHSRIHCDICNKSILDETEDNVDDDDTTPTTMRQRYYKRYYYTMANFQAREESAKRNLMKLEQRAKNFYKANKDENELNNLTCRNCFLSLSYDELIDHALNCYGVDRLIQFKKKVYHCSLCSYATQSRLYMIEHLVISHCNKTDHLYHCKPCNMGFERKALFERHKMYRHQHKFEYYCLICNKSYHKALHFKEHMDLHYGRRHRCLLCGRNTSSVQNLRFHMMAIHWGDHKNFSCVRCGKKFALKKQLKEHERVHTGYAPARCKICNQTFSLYSNLNAHYNKHLTGRRYSCSNCSLSFSYLSNLIRHRRIKHSLAEGKYVCNYCGKWYIDKRDYQDHVTVHLSRPRHPHQCRICNATFRIKKYLMRHLKTHTTQFECTLCDKTYKQNISLIRHSLRKHNYFNRDSGT